MALRAKREYLFSNGLLPEGMEPYPLIVVRPGSASTYAAARSAMTAWESEFGYELVEADLELDYQSPDPQLTMLLSDVVIEARGRRKMQFALMNRERSVQREVLRPSARGGFETVSRGSSSVVGRSNGPGQDSASRSQSGDGFGQSDGFGGTSGGNPATAMSQAGSPPNMGSRDSQVGNVGAGAGRVEGSSQSELGFTNQLNELTPNVRPYAGPVGSQQSGGFQDTNWFG